MTNDQAHAIASRLFALAAFGGLLGTAAGAVYASAVIRRRRGKIGQVTVLINNVEHTQHVLNVRTMQPFTVLPKFECSNRELQYTVNCCSPLFLPLPSSSSLAPCYQHCTPRYNLLFHYPFSLLFLPHPAVHPLLLTLHPPYNLPSHLPFQFLSPRILRAS